MTDLLEGSGHLFEDGCLIAAVRYRLLRFEDEWARSVVEGELQPRGRQALAHGKRYILLTQAGFSLPLEIGTDSGPDGWRRFHRIARSEVAHAVG